MTLKQIQRSVSKEAAAFRQETKKLTPSQIYDRACDIYAVEQMVYLIGECQEYYKEDLHIRQMLTELCTDRRFISEFIEWSSSANDVDLSNTDRALDSLSDFCLFCEKKKEEN